MKANARSPIRHRRRPARTRCPGAGTRLDCLDRSGPTVRRRTSSRQARCSQAAGTIATRIKRQRSFRRSRRGRWRWLLRRGWRVHPIAGAVSPNPCSRRGVVRPNPMPARERTAGKQRAGAALQHTRTAQAPGPGTRRRIRPGSHPILGQALRVSISSLHRAAGSDGTLVQVTREMATTAANTAKRARIIDNVGDHRWTDRA
jgi:hypothetical protein